MIVNFLISWFGNNSDNVGIVAKAARGLGFSISEIIYNFMIYLYNMFVALCSGQLLDNESLNGLFGRVGVLLGIIMFFSVSFSFIKYIIDPDSIFDKSKGITKIIQRIIIVIIMLGVSSWFFTILTNVQNAILNQHVISNLVLPYEVNGENFGKNLSAQLFLSFYDVSPNASNSSNDICSDDEYINTLRTNIINSADFSLANECLYETAPASNSFDVGGKTVSNAEVWVIDFNYIFCILVGVFVCWMLLNYTISVGARIVQMAVLQIISPMAIISYLSPKQDNMFSKWTKIYFSTYIDVFIRVAIIDFVVYLSGILIDNWNDPNSIFLKSVGVTASTDTKTRIYLLVIMIMALLMFAKKAPEIIKQLFPQSASNLGFGFGTKDGAGAAFKSFSHGASMATGAAVGGLIGAGMSGLSRYHSNINADKTKDQALAAGVFGGLTGLGRGTISGGKKGNMFKNVSTGIGNIKKVDNDYNDLIASGGSIPGKLKSQLTDLVGETAGHRAQREISNNQKIVDANNKVKDLVEGFSSVKKAKSAWETLQHQGASKAEIDAAFSHYKAVKKAMITGAMKDPSKFSDFEDRSLASQIQSVVTDTVEHVDSHSIELRDQNGNVINMRNVSTADQFNEAAVAASNNITGIKREPNYSANVANDHAAGVKEVGKN